MFRIYYLVFILLLAIYIEANEGDREHVYLRVYYESQCPDSKNFVMQQLKPAMELMHHFVSLELIPFGKAHSIMNGTSFKCQHGPTECMGNKIQACALNLMQHRADKLRIVNYVACELTTEAGAKQSLQCVGQAGANVDMVKECVISGKGNELQLLNEKKTNNINPKFIPTVTFDGEFDQEIQDASMRNLIRTICAYFNYSVRPCKLRLKKVYERFVKQQHDSK